MGTNLIVPPNIIVRNIEAFSPFFICLTNAAVKILSLDRVSKNPVHTIKAKPINNTFGCIGVEAIVCIVIIYALLNGTSASAVFFIGLAPKFNFVKLLCFL